MRTKPGRPYPLGATWDGAGVNFALFSEHAEKVFTLPRTNPPHQWERQFDTADDDAPAIVFDPGAVHDLRDRSSALFRTFLAASTEPAVTPVQAETMRKEIKRVAP